MEIKFNLPIRPQPKQSVRGGGKGFYTDPAKKEYVKALTMLIKSQYKRPAQSGPLQVSIAFCYKRPKGQKSDFKTSRPDLDNLSKPVLDALTDAGVITDDAIVCRLCLEKFYHDSDCILITITP